MAQKQICVSSTNPIKIKTLIKGQASLYESDQDDWVYVAYVMVRIEKEIGKTSYSYFIRAVDISEKNQNSALILDQEIYIPFAIKKRKTFFVYFATTKCHVGLSFVDEEISAEFYAIIKDINDFELEEFERRKQEKREKRLKIAQSVCDFTMNIADFSMDPSKKNFLGITDGRKNSSIRRGSSSSALETRSNISSKNSKKIKSQSDLVVRRAPKLIPDSDFDEIKSIRKKPPPKLFSDSNYDEVDFKAPKCGLKAIKYSSKATLSSSKKSKAKEPEPEKQVNNIKSFQQTKETKTIEPTSSKKSKKSRNKKRKADSNDESTSELSKTSLNSELNSKSVLTSSPSVTPTSTQLPSFQQPLTDVSVEKPSALNPARADFLKSIQGINKNYLKKVDKEPKKIISQEAIKPITMTDQLNDALQKFNLQKNNENNENKSDDEFK